VVVVVVAVGLLAKQAVAAAGCLVLVGLVQHLSAHMQQVEHHTYGVHHLYRLPEQLAAALVAVVRTLTMLALLFMAVAAGLFMPELIKVSRYMAAAAALEAMQIRLLEVCRFMAAAAATVVLHQVAHQERSQLVVGEARKQAQRLVQALPGNV
jgi:hypothetical protein